MRQKKVRQINDTFKRLRGRAPYPTSWCRIESRKTTWKVWRWGRCENTDHRANPDERHKSHRHRRSGWAFWQWGLSGEWGHIKSERRMLRRIYRDTKRAA